VRIAWFAPAPTSIWASQQAYALQAELSRAHTVALFDEARAHDFVWQHFRDPFDLCIYELGDGRRYEYLHAYLYRYPGVALIRTFAPHPYALRASRLIAVNDESATDLLALDLPNPRVRVAPPFSANYPVAHHEASAPVSFAVLDPTRGDIAARAMQRAIDAGAAATLLAAPTNDVEFGRMLQACDVVIALHWPPAGDPLLPALVGMSAGRPVVVFETEATAAWPALDPQTWQPRENGGDDPVVVSIDPRDEEHSLMLAIKRLAADAALRAQLGAAARAWWEVHATAARAAAAWTRIIEEAVTIAPPRPGDLPRHLTADGTQRAREILAPFGVSVDFLES
jgi:hypothetical protein